MYKRFFFGIFLVLIASCFLLIGCSSTPEAEPEVEEVVPVVTEEATEAIAVQEAVADFSAVNQQALNTVASAREAAVASGAESLFASEFAAADAAYEAAKVVAADGSADQSALLADVAARYKALEQMVLAEEMRGKINKYGFASVDEAAIAVGNSSYVAAKDALANNSTGAEALVSATAACASYGSVLSAGFKTLAEDNKADALAMKKNADSVKSEKADKEEYAKANLTMSSADTAYTAKNYELAQEKYAGAAEMFNDVFERVSEKRRLAEEAIARAKQKVDTAAVFAVEADSIAPLPEEEK